ncbi:MAG: lanthionine synthetase LanC family protein [Gemmatimonadaceae bacterium]
MSVDLTRPVALRADARLVPAARLPEAVRRAAGARRGEHALVSARSRAASIVVDADGARLLRRLAEPRRAADVLLALARERGAAPGAVLDAAFPLLERLARGGWLVQEGAEPAPAASLAVGDRVGAWKVTDVLRALEDTEVYRARHRRGRAGALKLVRAQRAAWLDGALAHEARVLRRLARTGVAPRPLARGTHAGAELLVCEWREGVAVTRAAAEARALGDGGLVVLALAREVAASYARLHGAGVVHGDVHPSNVLVGRDGAVTLLDFGHAAVAGAPGPAPARVGIPEFHEPELALALRRGGPLPAASPAGEQYAIGALLYEIFTGRRHLDFSLVREQLLRQVTEDAPLSFADAGAAPWPAAERVLRRALAKRPADRWASVAALADALRDVKPRARVGRTVTSGDAARARRRAFVDDVVALARPEGGWSIAWPAASSRVSARDGAAGVAYGLQRMAAARDDARLLALADLWSARAAALVREDPDVLFEPDGSLARAQLGEASLFHGGAGLHVTNALVGRALGDRARFHGAVAAFAASPTETPHPLDLAFGTPGLLAGAALLRDAARGTGRESVRAVADVGERLARALAASVRAGRASGLGRDRPGAAHGLAGALYALLRWRRSAADCAPLRAPLAELERFAVPAGRGLQWPWTTGRLAPGERPTFVGGWCNGGAGYVHLWLAAHRRLRDARWRRLAEQAGWNAWESAPGNASLCCGDAGRAYALLALHRRTRDDAWRRRAETLADRALANAGDPAASASLYRGPLGVAVLLADLERPAAARMPLFEPEGWHE